MPIASQCTAAPRLSARWNFLHGRARKDALLCSDRGGRTRVGRQTTYAGSERMAGACRVRGRSRRRALVILGGPLGNYRKHRAMLILDAPNEEILRKRLAEDPWMRDGVL